jgi:dTDP-4-dehydrorhamnose 3,5-epimerase
MTSASAMRLHFRKDTAKQGNTPTPPARNLLEGAIAGCVATPLQLNADDRGHLIELMTTRDCGEVAPIVHVYQVFAESLSVRAWVYHAKQSDRLAFTNGTFTIALFDLREESPTYRKLVTLTAGARSPVLLTIPPLVAHGVQNIGSDIASFVNFPTAVYDPRDPDKYRLPPDSLLIDFEWKTRNP